MSDQKNTEKNCINCGTQGCDHDDARRCGSGYYDWTPRKQAKQNAETRRAIKEAHHTHASDECWIAK